MSQSVILAKKRKLFFFFLHENLSKLTIKVGNDQEVAQSEGNSHSKNRGGKNKHIVSRVRSYFPIGGHSVTRA